MSQTRTSVAVIGILAVLLLTAGVAAGASGVAAVDNHDRVTNQVANGTAQTNETATNTTATNETANETDGGLDVDDQPARLFPVSQQEEWLTVEERERGEYNTTGTSVLFESPDPISNVNIRQPGASARVLGQNLILVEYESNAAATGESTLFNLDVVFEGGDSGTIDLYASQTAVSVGGSETQEYRGYILSALNDAEDAGYERSPQGLQNRYDGLLETEESYNNLLTEEAQQAVAWLIAGLTNTVVIGSGLLLLVLLFTYMLRRESETLRVLTEDPGRTARMRREVKQALLSDQRTAASTRLRDVESIGKSGEIYWQDAFDATTLLHLGELARGELPVQTKDGEILRIGGLEDITAANISDSWLEQVTRPGRLPTEAAAVSQIRAALHKLNKEHSNGHIYGDAEAECERILDELDRTQTTTPTTTSTAGTAAAGGDD